MAEIDLLTLKFHGMIHIVQFKTSPVAFANILFTFYCICICDKAQQLRTFSFSNWNWLLLFMLCAPRARHDVWIWIFFRHKRHSRENIWESLWAWTRGHWHLKFCSWNGWSWYEREIEIITSSLLIKVFSTRTKNIHQASRQKKWSCLIFSLHKIWRS